MSTIHSEKLISVKKNDVNEFAINDLKKKRKKMTKRNKNFNYLNYY